MSTPMGKILQVMKCDLCSENPIQIICKLKTVHIEIIVKPLLDELRICNSCYIKILQIED